MTAYSGFHFQRPINDWPRAAAILPNGTWIKFIDNVQALDEAKRVNAGLKTVLRHFDGGWQRFDFANHTERREHARAFLLSFVDGTFMNYAHNVDAIEGLNEYNASSHDATDRQKRVEWVRAISEEWHAIKQGDSRLAHIRLVVGNVAVGNDLPLDAARLVQQYGNIAGYHPYVPTKQGQVRPDEWRWYSGRWTEMDARYRAAGITVDWLFTEAGPIGYTGDHLGPNDGWRHSDVCNGNVDQLLAVCKYWMDKTAQWNATHGGRALGQVLYNSGGADNEWKLFEIAQPNMDAVAAFNRDYVPPKQPTPPPPPPEPDPEPEPEPRKYHRTAHLLPQDATLNEMEAVLHAAYGERQTVLFSADDAFSKPPEITGRTVYVWEVERVAGSKEALQKWVATHYAPVPANVRYRRIKDLFVADRWYFPLGTRAERESGEIPPGGWIDATGFLTRYWLGNGYAIHTGNDWNLNVPVFDMDRNKPVYPMAAGKVTFAGVPSSGWQGVVIIRHTLPDGTVMYSRSAHLQPEELFVKKDDWVKPHSAIGLTGRNLTSSGPGPYHLHSDLSPTSILLNEPEHWPGDNRDEVIRHYTDPAAWLRQRV